MAALDLFLEETRCKTTTKEDTKFQYISEQEAFEYAVDQLHYTVRIPVILHQPFLKPCDAHTFFFVGDRLMMHGCFQMNIMSM